MNIKIPDEAIMDAVDGIDFSKNVNEPILFCGLNIGSIVLEKENSDSLSV